MAKAKRRDYNKMLKVHETDQLNINIDLHTVDTFCSYALSENHLIRQSGLMNLKEVLYSTIDTVHGQPTEGLELKHEFCRDIVDYRLKYRINNRDLLIQSVRGFFPGKYDVIDLNDFRELPDTEIYWVQNAVNAILSQKLINTNITGLSDLCDQYISAELIDKPNVSKAIRTSVTELHNQFRKYDLDADSDDTEFLLSNPENTIDNVLNRMNSRSYKLRTGMQAMNAALAGGFEGSRVYCLFGLPGEGKTTTLLNLAYQIKMYNKRYECRDKTKRPVVVFFTMENTLRESVCTLYNIAVGDRDLRQYKTEEIIQQLAMNGMAVTPDSPIDIYIKYKPINSVDTNYLYTLTEQLSDQGMEVIAVLFDYIKRIRPVEMNDRDERFRLGQVINELKNFANYKDIPVITASQINRDGANAVDTIRGAENTTKESIRAVGRGKIGESSLIDENVDASIFIVPDPIPDRTQKLEDGSYKIKEKWLGVHFTKHRYRLNGDVRKLFLLPYEENNFIKLQCDADKPEAVYKLSLYDEKETKNKDIEKVAMSEPPQDLKDTVAGMKGELLRYDGKLYMDEDTMNLDPEDLGLVHKKPEEPPKEEKKEEKDEVILIGLEIPFESDDPRIQKELYGPMIIKRETYSQILNCVI